MNILPLIFAFLIIFSCFAATFLKEVKSFLLAETVTDSYDRVERNLKNFIVRKAYHKLKGETVSSNKAPNPTQPKKMKTYTSYRSLFPPQELSKFNLAPLAAYSGEFKLHPLYQPLAELLRILYGENLFKQGKMEKIEYQILDAMLVKAGKNPEAESLTELNPDDPVVKKIYYTMLKGTNQYAIHEKGIPPLEDFLCIRKESPAISFSFASGALLEALFGRETSSYIFGEEKKKAEESNNYYYLPKEELQALLMKNPAQFSQFSPLEPYIDYSKQFKPRTERGGKDEKTGLSVKKSI